MLATAKNQLQDTAGDYVYDAAGNLIQPGPIGGPYVFDAENHLISAGGMAYLYDGDGKRVGKAPANTPTQPNYLYWYGMGSQILEETDGAGNYLYIDAYFNGQLLARGESDNWVDHFFADALGNVRCVYGDSDPDGGCSDYYPFGAERTIPSCCPNSAGGVNVPFKFTSKERDSESGLDNFGARYNSSSMGRFMSPDPDNAGADLMAPQSWNAYSYVLNNPLNAIDPTGLDCVYLNDAGTGVDGPNGVDRNSNSGECHDNGGTWFDGTINSNSVRTDPNSDWVSAEGVTDFGLGSNQQFSCGGSSCSQDTLDSFVNSITGGPSSVTVTDESGNLSPEAAMTLKLDGWPGVLGIRGTSRWEGNFYGIHSRKATRRVPQVRFFEPGSWVACFRSAFFPAKTSRHSPSIRSGPSFS